MRLRYPWAIAPTIKTTKPVATAMATFASIDKFIIFPSIMAATRCPLFFGFYFLLFLHRFEFPRAYGCQAQREGEGRSKNHEGRRATDAAMFEVRGFRLRAQIQRDT